MAVGSWSAADGVLGEANSINNVHGFEAGHALSVVTRRLLLDFAKSSSDFYWDGRAITEGSLKGALFVDGMRSYRIRFFCDGSSYCVVISLKIAFRGDTMGHARGANGALAKLHKRKRGICDEEIVR